MFFYTYSGTPFYSSYALGDDRTWHIFKIISSIRMQYYHIIENLESREKEKESTQIPPV